MAEFEKIGDHVAGTSFVRAGYDKAELTDFVRLRCRRSPPSFSKRVLARADDLKLNFNEMDRAIAEGSVVRHDVGPSKAEIRMEIQGTKGDIVDYCLVVYLSREQELYVEDIRSNHSKSI